MSVPVTVAQHARLADRVAALETRPERVVVGELDSLNDRINDLERWRDGDPEIVRKDATPRPGWSGERLDILDNNVSALNHEGGEHKRPLVERLGELERKHESYFRRHEDILEGLLTRERRPHETTSQDVHLAEQVERLTIRQRAVETMSGDISRALDTAVETLADTHEEAVRDLAARIAALEDADEDAKAAREWAPPEPAPARPVGDYAVTRAEYDRVVAERNWYKARLDLLLDAAAEFGEIAHQVDDGSARCPVPKPEGEAT